MVVTGPFESYAVADGVINGIQMAASTRENMQTLAPMPIFLCYTLLHSYPTPSSTHPNPTLQFNSLHTHTQHKDKEFMWIIYIPFLQNSIQWNQ